MIPVKYHALSAHGKRQLRLLYIEHQKGLCYYCGESLNSPPPERIASKKIDWKRFPPNFLKHPIHLQHCHKTGMTEGAVHAYCNAYMFQYEGR